MFCMFSAVSSNIWPLAPPTIAKRVGPLQKLARGDRQTHFVTFYFWVISPKGAKTPISSLLRHFWVLGLVPEPSPGLEVEFPIKKL